MIISTGTHILCKAGKASSFMKRRMNGTGKEDLTNYKFMLHNCNIVNQNVTNLNT